LFSKTLNKFYVGYTGHEMLNEFTLINMNARLYDPVAGMMLSPDNVLQEPTNSQNYHKYAYCFNNPLKYNDPTGNYGDVPNVSQGMNSFNPYSGYNANIQTNYVSISNTTNSSTFNYQSTSISVNYTNQFNTFNYTSSYSSYNYTTPESVTWGYYESKSYSNNGVNILSSESKVEYSYPNYSEQFNDISWENSKTSTYAPIALSTAQSGGGVLDRTMNYLGNVATAAGMTIDWALGTGSDNRTFVNDNVAKAFMNANRVNEARNFYYNKYSGAKSLANTSVTGYKGSFGLSGLWNAGLDPIEQFVGTYRINVYNFSGNTLWFVLTNQTSMNSFLYDLGPSWQRSSWGPGGNMNQTYIWSEPVRK
jgi:RHS repeat-associated protein